jgi:hypothetical protein
MRRIRILFDKRTQTNAPDPGSRWFAVDRTSVRFDRLRHQALQIQRRIAGGDFGQIPRHRGRELGEALVDRVKQGVS